MKAEKDISQEIYIDLLKAIPFFSGLTNSELGFFVINAYQQTYRKNSQIFQYGEPADRFYVMLDGWVKLYRVNKEGEETVITLVTKGDTFSEVATFENTDYPYSSQVVGGEASCLVIPAHTVREAIRKTPSLALKMLASLSHHANQLSLTYENITRLSAAQRVGCFLLKLSMDHYYAKELNLPYNKYLVASRLGMKPETFSRAMARLHQDLKIVFRRREVRIPSISALQKYCEVECFDGKGCTSRKHLLCLNPQCDIYRILKLM